jgi:hypothetical protein
MATEQDLNSPDFTGNATSAVGALAIAATAKGQSRWLRRLLYVFMAIIVLAVGAGAIDKLVNINTLPGCDAQRTRDTLSDLNKANNVNASAYNSIKQVSKAETEIRCTASLALRAGGTLEYDYRIYREGGGIKVEITGTRGQ